MKQENPIDQEQREALARTLLRAGRDEEASSDPVFLAGFRAKLDQAREPSPAPNGAFGELCWKAIPALGTLAAVALLASVLSLSGRAEPGIHEEKVLWSLTSSGPTEEIGDDLILSAALLEEGSPR